MARARMNRLRRGVESRQFVLGLRCLDPHTVEQRRHALELAFATEPLDLGEQTTATRGPERQAHALHAVRFELDPLRIIAGQTFANPRNALLRPAAERPNQP